MSISVIRKLLFRIQLAASMKLCQTFHYQISKMSLWYSLPVKCKPMPSSNSRLSKGRERRKRHKKKSKVSKDQSDKIKRFAARFSCSNLLPETNKNAVAPGTEAELTQLNSPMTKQTESTEKLHTQNSFNCGAELSLKSTNIIDSIKQRLAKAKKFFTAKKSPDQPKKGHKNVESDRASASGPRHSSRSSSITQVKRSGSNWSIKSSSESIMWHNWLQRKPMGPTCGQVELFLLTKVRNQEEKKAPSSLPDEKPKLSRRRRKDSQTQDPKRNPGGTQSRSTRLVTVYNSSNCTVSYCI